MNAVPRVVFDTSTLVSAALRTGSVPYRALVEALAAWELCASLETLAELDRVVRRRKFARYLDAESRTAFAALVRRNARIFEVPEACTIAVDPSCRDAMDNKFLALAGIADADAIVSSDVDLVVLHPWNSIPIVSPADFISGVFGDWR
jgi:putative PIN family toxin of toxin-antitoxin system